MSEPASADLAQRRREARARDIAQEIDPQAGGFFRACLVEAALKGMEFERSNNPSVPLT